MESHVRCRPRWEPCSSKIGSDFGVPDVKCFLVAVVLLVSLPAWGSTWYVRSDGGTRFSAKAPQGQCDGTEDRAYSGHGVNQHCAFKDVRYLWTDGSYTTSIGQGAFPSWGWIGKGGDTYIIRGGPWRVGQNGPTSKDAFGLNGDPYDAGAPAPPSGTGAQHTRILGENFASCSEGKKTQLFGGFGVSFVLNLKAAYVDVQCLDITRHSECIRFGSPANPPPCHRDYPLDDYATDGIETDVHTHDLLLQDVSVHGFTDRGIIGPIGGLVNAVRVTIAYNGSAGWDFDDGHATPMVNGAIKLDHTIVEWNGCNQKYPGSGVSSCYSQSTGGYGDGIGTPAHTCISASVDHSTFRYNTQDGLDLLHNDTGNCSLTVTNSSFYGNNGAQLKWGDHDNPAVITNNTILGNCRRLSEAMDGAPANFNQNLQDFCRAQDTIAMHLPPGGSLIFANNTIVSYAPTTIDIDCDGVCSSTTMVFRNNIVLGYDNHGTYKDGGQPGGPGGFYFGHPIGHIVRTNNVFYGLRGMKCLPTEKCMDPKFVGEPHFMREQDLDHFNFKSSAPSLAGIGAQLQ